MNVIDYRVNTFIGKLFEIKQYLVFIEQCVDKIIHILRSIRHPYTFHHFCYIFSFWGAFIIHTHFIIFVIFSVFEEHSSSIHISSFLLYFQFLRSIRHPYILHYIRDGKDDNRYLVTERATPLSLLLADLSPIEITSGICNIISALSFLHDKVQVI